MTALENPFLPLKTKLLSYRDETPDTRTFVFEMEKKDLEVEPGQFMELTVFGYGEAPFSVSSLPKNGVFEMTIRKVGLVTNALFSLPEKAIVGIRGPFGRGWPIGQLAGKDILIIAGGIGLAPIRPLLQYIERNRESFGEVILLYGARTPSDLLYKYEFDSWRKFIDLHLTVDKADESWKGREGVVTVLFDEITPRPKDMIALQCGPPIMMYFVTKKLKELGFPDENIYLSLERLMKCGMGMCGRCTIGDKYVCKDGPVFCLKELEGFEKAL